MRNLLLFTCVLITISAGAQTNLILNGDFESTPVWTNWSSTVANGNLWGGAGTCTAHSGAKHIYMGSTTGYGANNAVEDMYQTVSIPSNTTSCIMDFYASINTLESGSTSYDNCYLRLRSTSGTLLATLGYISNTNGTYGIPGCASWIHFINVNIPSTYFGSTVRVSFEFTTDGSSPTIFRIDDISLMALSNPCTYSLSQYSYTCPSAASNTYSSIATLYTQSGCSWYANVVSGTSWLSSSSYGLSGGGYIAISVSQNTSSSSRTGTIDVMGETLTITQPGSCSYSLSQSTYTCPSASANTYSAITTVTTQTGCYWSGAVISGSSWLSTTSSGTGSGSLSITVLQNTTMNTRTGTINVNGQTLTINQPGTCTYSLSQSSYTCANSSANTYTNISTVATQTGCTWSASVTSGSSWLSTSSTGTGNGTITISTLQNSSSSARTGTININGQTLTITQPGTCSYSLTQSTYTCANASANTYSSILLVNTQAGCTWSASVTSGSAWLSTTSSGTGSGALSITVLQNSTTSLRTGTIDIGGQILTVSQPGITCTYSLGQSSYTCTNALANTYNSIVLVTTQSVCAWTATVTSGSSWLATSSTGTGSGSISIIVLQNTSVSSRNGTIDVNGQTLTITQPSAGTGIAETENHSFSIFPNPVKNHFDLEVKPEMIGSDFLIMDNLGRIVLEGKVKGVTNKIQIENLSSGVYFFKIKQYTQISKLVKE